MLASASRLWCQPSTVRIGSALAEPDAYILPDGRPAGFFVEVFREAAKREGLTITWVFSDRSADATLDSGKIDLYAGIFPTPERRRRLHLTEPWWTVPSYFAVAEDSALRSSADLAGRSLAYSNSPPLPAPVASLLPGVQATVLRAAADRLAAVCLGQADAALFTQPALRPLLRDRPTPCAQRSLRLIPQNDFTTSLVIGSQPAQAQLADRFRARLGEMALDGSLGQFARKFNQSPLLSDVLAIRSPWNPLSLGLALAALILAGGLAWTLFRWRASRQQAERAALAKEQFLAMMSHEIRTPMNAALGYMDLLLETRLEPEQRSFVEDIGRATSSLLSVLSGIMEYAKLRSEAPSTSAEPFDVPRLIDEVVATIALTAESKGLDLLVDVRPQVPTELLGDASRLRQVLTNLLANSIKFTEAGYVRLQINFTTSLEVTVADSGIGIPPEKQNEIFEPFAQVDSSDSRSHGGVGLGLAIVRALVTGMNGTLRLESRVGFGSQFHIRLPFLGTGAAPGWLEAAAGHGGRGQLVIVAASTANAHLLTEYFRHLGWEVWTFPDAGAAQSQAPALKPGWWLATEAAAAPDAAALAQWALVEGASRTLLLSSTNALRLVPEATRLAYSSVCTWPITPATLRRLLQHEDAPIPLPAGAALLPVLVVDDNPINRKVAGALLSRLGCTVEYAENGRIALEKCRLTRFGLVLMDCQMPIMDGYESTQRIRAMATDRIPIYGVSASTDMETYRRCLDAGMDGFSPKPVSLQNLRVLLKAVAPRSAPAS
jgi:signal transduction histidine kinase/CheY-like chemotaxis protein